MAARRSAAIAGVGVDEDFEPLAEPCGVELLVGASTSGFPEVEVEDGRQLGRGGQRKQLTAILQAVVRDHGVQDLGAAGRARRARVVDCR